MIHQNCARGRVNTLSTLENRGALFEHDRKSDQFLPEQPVASCTAFARAGRSFKNSPAAEGGMSMIVAYPCTYSGKNKNNNSYYTHDDIPSFILQISHFVSHGMTGGATPIW